MCIYIKKLLKTISFKYLLQRIRKRKHGEKLANITYTLVSYIKYSKFYFSESNSVS